MGIIFMKSRLAILTILIFTLSTLFAEDFTYGMTVDKPKPYVKEGVLLNIEFNQTNSDIVLFFNFDIKKSKDYEFVRLDSSESDTHHNAHLHYLYLLYPLKEGKIEVEFTLLKKITNDESIAYSYSGDRDNVKTLVTQNTPVTLPPLILKVKPLPIDTLFVGDFRLSHSIKKHQAKAYEPISFNLTLEGEGYPPLLDSILPKEGNFTRFTEKPLLTSHVTKSGIHNKIVYAMALSHNKSFELSPLVFKVFNPKIEKSYELTIPAQKFEIEEVLPVELIDKIDFPIKKKVDSSLSSFSSLLGIALSYILTFIAGYISAIAIKRRKKNKNIESSWIQRVKECRDKKELLQLLMVSNNKNFYFAIEELEGALYREEIVDLNEIKRKIIKKSNSLSL